MQIAIIGYGKMGREIEKHARNAGIDVAAIIDNAQDWQSQSDNLAKADVAIEFTSPSTVQDNVFRLLDMGLPVVTGTTGWHDKLQIFVNHCRERNGSFFYASNFSIGVNLFFALNRHLSSLMAAYPEYKIWVEETHHLQKLDAPSGTAVTLLEDIQAQRSDKTGWVLTESQETEPEKIPVTAHREEGVTGTHVVHYQSAIDSLSIRHEAHNREGFARGALMAAQWLPGKQGVYTMRDLLNL
ncbi:MAG: 4-hydroxy-tetrahydrodipicolinate reductase [Bacteroidales bacterium]